MEKETEKDIFWTGGSWEQPTSRYLPPDTPNEQLTSSINRSKAFRNARNRMFRWIRFGAGVLVTGTILACIAVGIGGIALPSISLSTSIPGGSGGGSWSGGGSSGGSSGGYIQEETSDAVSSPRLAQGALLTEDLISLDTGDSPILTPQEIYSQVASSVVYIETLSDYGIGAGTGIIISEDGYIVTNAHVISDATTAIVTLWDETSYPATLIGWDGDEDLAVIKIDVDGLNPVTFGDSSDLVVGDTAYAIGNPLGSTYRSTFTDGIISALDRYLDIDGVYMSLIQTTTPINMGNSGGALLNDSGQVVGITTIKIMSSSGTIENMGFAIPSSRVVTVVNCLVQGIELTTPALGITIYEVTDPVRGLLIHEVVEDSYADEAGLLPGDIITHAAGTPVYYNNDLAQIKDSLLVGDTLVVTIYRDGFSFNVDVILSDYAEVHPDS